MIQMVALIFYGAAMATLVGMGGADLIYHQFLRGIPMLVAGLSMYAAIPFII